MRVRINIIGIILIGFFAIVACSKDDSNQDPDPTNQNSADQVEEIAESGSWAITYFFDSDDDETSNFSGYSFSFNTDGSLVATKGNTTVTGTWSVEDDSSNSNSDDDGNSTDDDDFNIFFPVPETNDFEDLNDDWDIIRVTDTKIELIDVSGGNGGTDYLTFEKN